MIHTGYRWHTRAWCEKSSEFRDFVLSRISDAPGITLAATHGPGLDTAWNTHVTITLKPDPRLTLTFPKCVTGAVLDALGDHEKLSAPILESTETQREFALLILRMRLGKALRADCKHPNGRKR